MTYQAKEVVTEEFLRKKLEVSGELARMRAMIVDTALKTLSEDPNIKSRLFSPTPRLKAEKESAKGRQSLSVVMEYLEHMGLNYTLSVLKQEAALTECALQSRQDIVRELGLPEGSGPILTTIMGAPGAAGANSGVSKDNIGLPTTTPESAPVPRAPVAQTKTEDGEDTTYFISKWSGRTFYRSGGQVSGQQVQLEYLTNCTVYVLDPLDSITVDDCEGGELIIAACEGSVFLRNCKNMTVHVACKQLRTRDCEYITLHIFATTDPVVESSHHINFKPFYIRLPGLQASFKSARLDPKTNRFVHVYDFTEDDPKLPKPHFTVTYKGHGLCMKDLCGEKGKPDCPQEIEDFLAGRLGPAASSESGHNKSYNIKTGAEEWTGNKESSSPERGKEATPPESASRSDSSAPTTPHSRKDDAVPAPAAATGDALDGSYSSFDDDEDEDENDSQSDKKSEDDDDDDSDDF
ncbi:hypothetical protein, conserved [Trypanosoma brucei brucei TREU927]|uniref:C-CAP/cofactor C-like domain-containing protein n=1 Tax=Trypanosoma brucei brucei (strain 927/4 GUTat10.1) TaxID=185431 RepID=Q388J8_TRYB2|nr:hypothetical protein, conserved [Trypanosoma brucei brucei TREU927]EAN78772.1 hypothetical protein, conserved [Trypanosoma brucei brucei TREU927]